MVKTAHKVDSRSFQTFKHGPSTKVLQLACDVDTYFRERSLPSKRTYVLSLEPKNVLDLF